MKKTLQQRQDELTGILKSVPESNEEKQAREKIDKINANGTRTGFLSLLGFKNPKKNTHFNSYRKSAFAALAAIYRAHDKKLEINTVLPRIDAEKVFEEKLNKIVTAFKLKQQKAEETVKEKNPIPTSKAKTSKISSTLPKSQSVPPRPTEKQYSSAAFQISRLAEEKKLSKMTALEKLPHASSISKDQPSPGLTQIVDAANSDTERKTLEKKAAIQQAKTNKFNAKFPAISPVVRTLEDITPDITKKDSPKTQSVPPRPTEKQYSSAAFKISTLAEEKKLSKMTAFKKLQHASSVSKGQPSPSLTQLADAANSDTKAKTAKPDVTITPTRMKSNMFLKGLLVILAFLAMIAAALTIVALIFGPTALLGAIISSTTVAFNSAFNFFAATLPALAATQMVKAILVGASTMAATLTVITVFLIDRFAKTSSKNLTTHSTEKAPKPIAAANSSSDSSTFCPQSISFVQRVSPTLDLRNASDALLDYGALDSVENLCDTKKNTNKT